MNTRAIRTRTVTIRVEPKTYEAAQLVGRATGRTVSGLIEYAIKRYIEKNFPEAYSPGARVTIKIDDAPD